RRAGSAPRGRCADQRGPRPERRRLEPGERGKPARALVPRAPRRPGRRGRPPPRARHAPRAPRLERGAAGRRPGTRLHAGREPVRRRTRRGREPGVRGARAPAPRRGVPCAPHPAGAPPGDTTAAALAPPVPRRLEFAGAALSGLVGLDAGRTGRLLLFPAAGGLVLFTGERLGHTPGGLRVEPSASGGLTLRYDGPLL